MTKTLLFSPNNKDKVDEENSSKRRNWNVTVQSPLVQKRKGKHNMRPFTQEVNI